MEAWKLTWRKGVASQLSTAGLSALLKGLVADDSRLVQGVTCQPPPLQSVQDWPTEAGDAIVYAYWQGDREGELLEVQEAEEFFARVCYECDNTMGEPASCRWFLNAYDDNPRQEFFSLLAAEVRHNLLQRHFPDLDFPEWEDDTPIAISADWLEESYGQDVAEFWRQLNQNPPLFS